MTIIPEILMAVGSLFLGQARNKLGEIVLTRMFGKQISKSYNANPKYSNVAEQALIRMSMNTCVHAYQALKEICDHSFEGHGNGMPCMRRFLKYNQNQLKAGYGRYIFKDGTGLAPYQFLISQGSLDNPLRPVEVGEIWVGDTPHGAFVWELNQWGITSHEAVLDLTLGQFLEFTHLKRGDQITFVCISPGGNNIYKEDTREELVQEYYSAKYFEVRISMTANETVKVFSGNDTDFYFNSQCFSSTYALNQFTFTCEEYKGRYVLKGGDTPWFDDSEWWSGAVIMSRREGKKWLRSTETLLLFNHAIAGNFSLQKVLPTYEPTTALFLNK